MAALAVLFKCIKQPIFYVVYKPPLVAVVDSGCLWGREKKKSKKGTSIAPKVGMRFIMFCLLVGHSVGHFITFYLLEGHFIICLGLWATLECTS